MFSLAESVGTLSISLFFKNAYQNEPVTMPPFVVFFYLNQSNCYLDYEEEFAKSRAWFCEVLMEIRISSFVLN
jgi:hypothetical protein